jgi:hypothetical protein
MALIGRPCSNGANELMTERINVLVEKVDQKDIERVS